MTYAHTLYGMKRYGRTSLLFKTGSGGVPGSIHTLCSDFFLFFFLFYFTGFTSLIGTDIFDLDLKGKKL